MKAKLPKLDLEYFFYKNFVKLIDLRTVRKLREINFSPKEIYSKLVSRIFFHFPHCHTISKLLRFHVKILNCKLATLKILPTSLALIPMGLVNHTHPGASLASVNQSPSDASLEKSRTAITSQNSVMLSRTCIAANHAK